jgi:putative thiamine transport system substrate-binding protein
LKSFLFLLLFGLSITLPSFAAPVDASNWSSVLEDAKGETVYFNAWGGDENINAYIQWAGTELEKKYDVKVVHVKLNDTAAAISKILLEKTVGHDENGSIDMVWVNGENFASLKQKNLLLGDTWAEKLPNWKYVDFKGKPTVRTDFTLPVDGQEAPWGMAKMVFFYDNAKTKISDMPKSVAELLKWTEKNPGRFSYPIPPDFVGTSFLKQILLETIKDKEKLLHPVVEAEFVTVTTPLFYYLDQLNHNLWRGGKSFPQSYPDMKRLMGDDELDIIFSFNPADASAAIRAAELPSSVRSFIFTNGTLGNTHFVAIPYNAKAKAGALVLANFLMSPEAQAHKQDPDVWGDPTVLNMKALSKDEKAAFDKLNLGLATLKPDELGPSLNEPHPSWVGRIEKEWKRRYGTAQ